MNQYNNTWTTNHDAQLCDLWPIKKTREIAETMGFASSWIAEKANRLGLPKRKLDPWTPEKVSLLREYLPIKTTQEMADLLGHSTNSVLESS